MTEAIYEVYVPGPFARFVQPLSKVLDYHMKTHKLEYRINDLLLALEAKGGGPTKQAIYSALTTLMKNGVVVRGTFGYHHACLLTKHQQRLSRREVKMVKMLRLRNAALAREAAIEARKAFARGLTARKTGKMGTLSRTEGPEQNGLNGPQTRME